MSWERLSDPFAPGAMSWRPLRTRRTQRVHTARPWLRAHLAVESQVHLPGRVGTFEDSYSLGRAVRGLYGISGYSTSKRSFKLPPSSLQPGAALLICNAMLRGMPSRPTRRLVSSSMFRALRRGARAPGLGEQPSRCPSKRLQRAQKALQEEVPSRRSSCAWCRGARRPMRLAAAGGSRSSGTPSVWEAEARMSFISL